MGIRPTDKSTGNVDRPQSSRISRRLTEVATFSLYPLASKEVEGWRNSNAGSEEVILSGDRDSKRGTQISVWHWLDIHECWFTAESLAMQRDLLGQMRAQHYGSRDGGETGGDRNYPGPALKRRDLGKCYGKRRF